MRKLEPRVRKSVMPSRISASRTRTASPRRAFYEASDAFLVLRRNGSFADMDSPDNEDAIRGGRSRFGLASLASKDQGRLEQEAAARAKQPSSVGEKTIPLSHSLSCCTASSRRPRPLPTTAKDTGKDDGLLGCVLGCRATRLLSLWPFACFRPSLPQLPADPHPASVDTPHPAGPYS